MGYAQAVEKAWNAVAGLSGEKTIPVRLLSDTYDVNIDRKTVMSVSCNIPAKEHIAIIALHYLIRKLQAKKLPALTGEWIDFNQLEGGEGYYPAFKKRTIAVILRKFGPHPEALLKTAGRFPSETSNTSDAGIILHPLEGVAMLINMWKADAEFGPEANILFDKNISQVFCTEDIVVLTEIVVHAL